jgi:hypothetical protein
MTISLSDALAAFELLRAAGLRPPQSTPEATAAAWVACLPELDGASLALAVRAHLRDGSPYWPTPGQLLGRYRPSTEGEADAAWARLRALRSVHAGPPSDPHGAPWWRLSDDCGAELVRHRIVLACGGYATLAQRDRASSLDAARASIEQSASYRPWYRPDGTADPERLRGARPALPTRAHDAARAAAASYARQAVAADELREVARLWREHGRTEHRAPTVVPPWRLDTDSATEARLWRALQAAGGWACVPTASEEDSATDDERIRYSTARAAFGRVWRGQETRDAQAEAIGLAGPSSVAGLLRAVGGALALPG